MPAGLRSARRLVDSWRARRRQSPGEQGWSRVQESDGALPIWCAPRRARPPARRRLLRCRRARRARGTGPMPVALGVGKVGVAARPLRAPPRARGALRLWGPATIDECAVSAEASVAGYGTRAIVRAPTDHRMALAVGQAGERLFAKNASRGALIGLSPDASSASAGRSSATISASSSTRSA